LPYLVQGRRLRVVCGDLVDWDFDDTGVLAIVSGIYRDPTRSSVSRRADPAPKYWQPT
jgi:hypothetical protein